MSPRAALAALAALWLLNGCATSTQQPYDYSNFRAHEPRSILVLPPLNHSTDLDATYGWLSTVSRPLAEHGYYVFPVEVVDRFLKENGLPTAGDMHQVPLEKMREVTGADAVLFVTLEQYGSKYQLINTATIVRVHAQLVDTRTQVLLWEGHGHAEQDSSSGSSDLFSDLISALVAQVINSRTHPAHEVSRLANYNLFLTANVGLPLGPYSPRYSKQP